jgi:hypothetical protein
MTSIARTGILARWPTALALVQVGALLPVILVLGARTQFAPGMAAMAAIYVAAYAVGRPGAAWLAGAAVLAINGLLVLLGVNLVAAGLGMAALLVPLWGWALARGRARDGRWFTIETAGAVGFGALTVLAVLVDPVVGGVLAGLGWLAHGIWDGYHFVRGKVVDRYWSEMCCVVDIPVGITLIVANLASSGT